MPFPLVRYFALTSLFFFLATGSALGYFYREMALQRMLQQQEAGNVNLTRVFANTLWRRHFSALLQASAETPSQELKNLSRIQEIHGEVLPLMRGSTTYKIKVYDPRGRTVYSSELGQIGEDKSSNPGFRGAMAGEIRTELVHKEKFSAFEQVVENRDLIQSYIPQYDDNATQPAGVFEIYSDATPFLAEIHRTERLLALLVVASLGALFAALFLIVRHADRLIRRQEGEHRATQQQLAQSEKMASLGQLVAGVTHQLNTPLGFSRNNVTLTIAALRELSTPLLVATRLAELVRKLPPAASAVTLNLGNSRAALAALSIRGDELQELTQMLDDVLGGLEQMGELVSNLRDFTRLDRSKVVDADLAQAIRTVIYIARSAIPPRIRIVDQLGELPSVACNPSQLNQVFLNLITNAAQAIPESGEIRVSGQSDGTQIRLEFSDTGSGIPPAALPHIFDSFFTTKPRGVGTGLGLAIARDIISNHGGTIAVASSGSAGTTFAITLPVNTPESVMDL